jgi:MarR family 2-MHQ and catechol resistance regulon transcriptional repressor
MGTRHNGSADQVRALNAYIKLMRAADSVTARISRHLSEHDLTISQFGILETLYHLGELHQNTLGQKLLKSNGNITLVVDNLEKRGWAVRERCAEDRRFVWVKLTDNGRQFIAKLFPGVAELIEIEMRALDEAEVDSLGNLCRKLGKAVEANSVSI